MTRLNLNIPTPRAYKPLLGTQRFQGARGGRGGGKSRFFGELHVEECLNGHTRLACLREIQNSIKDSVKQLLEDNIRNHKVNHLFKITEREIVCPSTDSLIVFRGLQNHTATSIKSLEGFNRAWYEEAQTLTKRSLELATPTFRTPGTQQRFSWNQDKDDDPVETLFNENKGDPDFICIDVNYWDNPWFPDDLRKDMMRDKARDPEKYDHVWCGGYRQNSEAQVFRNWRVEGFEPPASVTKFYLGADWGFSIDPTVLVLSYIIGRTLYIWREVWAIGCEIDRTPALFDRIDPEWTEAKARDPRWKSLARRLPITADSARPETISYMKNHGFPNIQAAIKGPGSVEDGIEDLRGYDIVIHPQCEHVRQEFRLYSYKIDKKTGKVTRELSDKKNHTIDSVRYALENVRRAGFSHSQELR